MLTASRYPLCLQFLISSLLQKMRLGAKIETAAIGVNQIVSIKITSQNPALRAL
jgi:activator of 2-hydroxyglutaryl-CoA dehydratase